MMKNTALQVVLGNTDGVTVSKLAMTAKIGLTSVHHERIHRHHEVWLTEARKNQTLKLHADCARYHHGDVPVECRIIEVQSILEWTSVAERVDGTRVVTITKRPTMGLADETAFWERMFEDVWYQFRFRAEDSDGEYTEYSGPSAPSSPSTDPEDYTDHRYLLWFPIRHEM